MSTTEATTTNRSTTSRASREMFPERVYRETKPSFMTTEFWAMLIGIVALVVIYNASHDPSLDLFRASLLATILAVGYMVSRGFAKAGSRDSRDNDDRTNY